MSKEFLYKYLQQGKGKVTTDSRKIQKGDVFFALKGDNFNGNLFAKDALEKGCSMVVIDEDILPKSKHVLRVENVLSFLQEIAILHRNSFNIPVIAIGGSNGKTTTKELLFYVLARKFRVHKTPGNFNNHIGVPLSILGINKDTEIAIIELGTNSLGEIAQLCQIAQPNFGLITNIGKEHLEGFGSLENIAKEESELFLWLHKNGGTAFVNGNDEWLMRMSRSLTNRIVFPEEYTWTIQNKKLMPKIEFTLNGISFFSDLMGDYNFQNIQFALGVGHYFKIELEEIQKGIAEYIPKNQRSQWVKWRNNDVLLDCYNANPSSMELAVHNFSQLHGNKILILGDMFELGKEEISEHQKIIDLCEKLDFKNVSLVGTRFGKCKHNYRHYPKTEMVKLLEMNTSSSFILVKGSRGMKLESLFSS
ncbi:MAG: UDP-N-acetylmuramoyl-tripeptide--D-alanyl-D-alanine ligase [Bacteroidetes bacterium MED-G17]|nr:MAG: UDP-N-acetylmuramoyl-tripeptide--D-alanyl-D-alanine ligase [Bacteroidetes bacterium MED-G17]|tara:strand:- start:15994 stop:17253 length:1260 start_codon:yes stop_codon:yes gene_type:complete